jgi:hypothetical protein
VVGRVALFVAGLAVLGAGCDSGSDDAENGPETPASESTSPPSSDAVEACRGVYERLPPATKEATTEDAFIESCLAILSGKPDPGLPPTS